MCSRVEHDRTQVIWVVLSERTVGVLYTKVTLLLAVAPINGGVETEALNALKMGAIRGLPDPIICIAPIANVKSSTSAVLKLAVVNVAMIDTPFFSG